jgi:hypothetical protein
MPREVFGSLLDDRNMFLCRNHLENISGMEEAISQSSSPTLTVVDDVLGELLSWGGSLKVTIMKGDGGISRDNTLSLK